MTTTTKTAEVLALDNTTSTTSNRRRSLAIGLVFAVGAAATGSVLGLVAQPRTVVDAHAAEAFAFTTAAAVETARHAEERARHAEQQLAQAKAQMAEFAVNGATQELADYQEAQRLGVDRFMKDSTALWGEQRRLVMAAIVREARKNGLDPLMVAAVIQVESRFDPYAVSGVGAKGLMQLMVPTAQWLLDKGSRDTKLKAEHLFNPILNIELGTMYVAQLLQRFDGDINLALIAYNAGPGTARSLTPGSKSFVKLSVYPKAVLAAYRTMLNPKTAQTLASR